MFNSQSLTGQTALITGANGDIGRAICISLLEQGANLAITSRHLDRVRKSIAEAGVKAERYIALELDVRDSVSVDSAIDRIVNRFGRIDILVNNAGVNKISSILDVADDDFDEIVKVNLRGVYLLSKAVTPLMIKHGSGKIINISSQAGKVGEAFNSAYCASKFAVTGFSQSLARELAPHGVMVYAVCPGPVDTQLLQESILRFANLFKCSPGDQLSRIIQQTAIGRLLSPNEVASVVAFLACSDTNALTGASIQVTGGVTMW